MLIAAANRLTREMAGDQGMIGAQIGLNVNLCSKNCKFCSFAKEHGLIKEGYGYSVEKCRAMLSDARYNQRLLPNYQGSWFELYVER